MSKNADEPRFPRARVVECVVFLFVGMALATPPVVLLLNYPNDALDVLARNHIQLLLALVIGTLPIVVILLFGNTPAEMIRRRRAMISGAAEQHSDPRPLSWYVSEAVVFAVIGLAMFSRIALLSLQYPKDLPEIFQQFYLDALLGLLAITFPVLHKLTFGITLRQRFLRNRPTEAAKEGVSHQQADGRTSTAATVDVVPRTRGEAVLHSYVAESREIAEGLYTRAGIYLILGVVIAFSGLFFFYTQTATTPVFANNPKAQATSSPNGSSAQPNALRSSDDAVALLSARVADLLPRFGILSFIELVAFFFLRQYRSAMDEFRYFEAIKRYRQEIFALVCYVGDSGAIIDQAKLLDSRMLFSTGVGVTPPVPSGVFDTGKLSKDEAALLEKIVAAITGKRAG